MSKNSKLSLEQEQNPEFPKLCLPLAVSTSYSYSWT